MRVAKIQSLEGEPRFELGADDVDGFVRDIEHIRGAAAKNLRCRMIESVGSANGFGTYNHNGIGPRFPDDLPESGQDFVEGEVDPFFTQTRLRIVRHHIGTERGKAVVLLDDSRWRHPAIKDRQFE